MNEVSLLKKYNTIQTGESSALHRTAMKEYRTSHKIMTAQIKMGRLGISGTDKDRVIHLIKNTNFKQLHGRASSDTIISALCFYIMKSHNSGVKIEDYSVFTEDGLDYKIYSTIITNLYNLNLK